MTSRLTPEFPNEIHTPVRGGGVTRNGLGETNAQRQSSKGPKFTKVFGRSCRFSVKAEHDWYTHRSNFNRPGQTSTASVPASRFAVAPLHEKIPVPPPSPLRWDNEPTFCRSPRDGEPVRFQLWRCSAIWTGMFRRRSNVPLPVPVRFECYPLPSGQRGKPGQVLTRVQDQRGFTRSDAGCSQLRLSSGIRLLVTSAPWLRKRPEPVPTCPHPHSGAPPVRRPCSTP